MESGRPKSLNSEDVNSCRISMWDEDEEGDDDEEDRVGHIDYGLTTRASKTTSSDNYSFSENMSPSSKGSAWNDNGSVGSYAKAQFERQVAQKDAVDCCQIIDRCKHLCDFGVDENNDLLITESAYELENAGADEVVLGSRFQADEYNELIHKNNSECFDEELSCESDENEHDIEEPCRAVKNECRKEFNSLISQRNTEQFDEVMSIDSDEDLVRNRGLSKSGYYTVKETAESNSEQKELADSDFKRNASEWRVRMNGYDAASHRKACSSKHAGPAVLSSMERCSNLLSSCAFSASQSSAMDSEKKREQRQPFVGSDQDSENDVTSSNYQANRSDDSDDFSERNSDLHIQQLPFFPKQNDLRGTGDWLQSSGLRGYPQYPFARYGSFSSDLVQSSYPSTRYHQLREKRQSRKDRQDAAIVKASDVPGYKGNLGVEELLMYINDSTGSEHQSESQRGVDASIGRSAEKAGKRRKKGGSKSTEKSDRVGLSSKSMDKRTGDAKVIKTNERVRVKSISKLNRANVVSVVEENVSNVSHDQKTVSDSMSRIRACDSSLAFLRETCDIPQGNADSIKTVTVDRQLDRSLTQSCSSPVLRSTSVASAEDDFTMVTKKKKKSKKNNSKRAKQPRVDRFPVSSDDSVWSIDDVNDFVPPPKESAVDCNQTKTRNNTLSKSSRTFNSPVNTTHFQDGGLYVEARDETMGNEVQRKLSKVYVRTVVASQCIPTTTTAIWESRTYDSVANKSSFHDLSSHSKPAVQSREKKEWKKPLTVAENLFVPQQITARASLESGVKQVTAETQSNSEQTISEQSEYLSVEKLEMSPLRKLQNPPRDNVTDPKDLSEDESVKPEILSQDEDVISEKRSLSEKVILQEPSEDVEVIFRDLSQDEEVISQNLSQDEKVIFQNLAQDEEVISHTLSHDEKVMSGNLSQDLIVMLPKLSQNENVVYQDETDVLRHITQRMSQNENSSQSGIEMYEVVRQDEVAVSETPAEEVIEAFQILSPIEQSLPQEDSLDDSLLSAQATSVKFYSPVPPSEQPVVFLDRQRRLFSVPARKDLGLKFGHFDDCDGASEESRTPPFPGPINFFHYIPVPYNHEDGQDKPMADPMMYPLPHQYMPQLVYANGPLPPLCKPAFQVYPNSHLFPVPMQFPPFLPPGYCVMPHTASVPVGVVSPTMNSRSREEEIPLNKSTNGDTDIMEDDSCVAGFAIRQSAVIPMEPVAQFNLQPEPTESVVTNSSLSSSGRCKSVFDKRTAVEYLYSEWLDVKRQERVPNGRVVRYDPQLDL